MPAITFQDFSSGLDLRKGASVSDASRLRVLKNCFVTTGKTIRKRPGLTLVATLEQGTSGLRAAAGKLNTFYGSGSITHANTSFVANKVTHPTLPDMGVHRIQYADVFNGYIYTAVEYNNGDIRHHYLDDVSSVAAWDGSKSYEVSDVIRPVTSNGYRYQVTSEGVSSETEPTWPTTIGATVTEPITSYTALSSLSLLSLGTAYQYSSSASFVAKCTTAGCSMGVSRKLSDWPTTLGAKVSDDDLSYPAWTASKGLAAGEYIRPVSGNGWVYLVTVGGVTGASQPAWPTTYGSTVANGTVTFKAAMMVALQFIASEGFGGTGGVRMPIPSNGFVYKVVTAGTTGASQPTWPTTVGTTVSSGTAIFECCDLAEYELVSPPTYTCRASEVYDENCPNTAAVVKKASKLFAIDDDVVRFCATSAPKDWTTSSDAGFLGVGIQQTGATNPSSLGEYAGNLVVFFTDSSQVWTVDPDPSKMEFVQSLAVGCPYPNGAANMAGDVFFASFDGVRSITTQSTTGNLIDVDVGSPIDSVIKPEMTVSANVRAFYFRGGGQYWLMKGSKAWIYSFSRTSKISAWSYYEFPYEITDVTEMDGDLFFRSGDSVYKLDEYAYSDAGTVFDVSIEFPYLDFKTPGVLKQIISMDTVMVGEAAMQIKFDARQPDFVTPPIEMVGDTRPGEMTAVEVVSVGIAPVITNSDDKEFELHAITFYYENLAAIS